ncbi:hypothetical protein [Staphylococcus epidermidis]|nr:hypothetical protein [Staphylococcus epidermidis]
MSERVEVGDQVNEHGEVIEIEQGHQDGIVDGDEGVRVSERVKVDG